MLEMYMETKAPDLPEKSLVLKRKADEIQKELKEKKTKLQKCIKKNFSK